MEIIFQENPPATRREFHDFVQMNLQKLILLYLSDTAKYLSTVKPEDFWERNKKAEKEYGEFHLMAIPASLEGQEENLDGVQYKAIEVLQKHFMDVSI